MHRQYVKNIGRNLKITLANDTRTKGKLLEVSEEAVRIEKSLTKKEVKEGVNPIEMIDFKDIKQAKIEISFK